MQPWSLAATGACQLFIVAHHFNGSDTTVVFPSYILGILDWGMVRIKKHTHWPGLKDPEGVILKYSWKNTDPEKKHWPQYNYNNNKLYCGHRPAQK